MVGDKVCKGCAFRIMVGIAALVLLMAGGAATPITSCTAISSPGEYVLTRSIIDSQSNCIYITSSDVVLDGAGYTIDGRDKSNINGVYVYNSTTKLSNITVKNLKVTDWDHGIYFSNTQDGSIANNTVNSNYIGIRLKSSSYNTLIDNNLSSNSAGILLDFSSNNNLINNTASSNGYYDGVSLWYSNYNTLINNNASSNSWVGISLSYSSGNTLTNNTANSNIRTGIYLYSSNNDKIYFNNFINNTINVHFYNSTNIWNSTSPITYTYNSSTFTNHLGNYWSDYNGSDAMGMELEILLTT